MSKIQWSLVCPIKDEIDLIPVTLPSFFKVKPSEVVLCFDNPPHKEAYRVVKKIASRYNVSTKFVFVNRNPEFAFHQAWVRRKGFLEAEYDKILTTDIDLVVNKNVLQAVKIVGKNDIGLVSCQKFNYPKSLVGFWRIMGRTFLKKFVYPFWHRHRGEGLQMTTFTGLYALYRPYWLDSEDDNIKKLKNPKTALRKGNEPIVGAKVCLGEDTYLRNCMEQKHNVAYLNAVGAIIVTERELKHHSHVQFERGRYYFDRGRSVLGAIVTMVMHFQPYYLKGYFYERRRQHTQKQEDRFPSYSLGYARKYWSFVPTSLGRIKVDSTSLLNKSDVYIRKLIEKSIKERNLKENAMIYRKKVISWIKRKSVKKVLDFGCGSGQDGVYFALNLDVHITFADIVKSNVDLVARYSAIWNIQTNAVYVDSEPEHFTFPKTYDMIYANGVLHHTPKAKEIVQNLKRFLTPNGLFICMLYTPKHFKATKAKNLKRYAKRSEALAPLDNPYSDYYDCKKAELLFEGFLLLDTWTTHRGKFGWYVFQKE